MLRVALTGGLGSGKSTAAGLFRELGCHVSESDAVGRAMMQPNEAVYGAIVDRFGKGVLKDDGALDRAALAHLAFDQGRLEELNGIVHPAVIAWQTAWMAKIGQQHPRGVAMVESALVFETKHGARAAGDGASGDESWRSRFDRVVLVTAPEELRIARYVDRYLGPDDASSTERRAAAAADARSRMRAQLPDEAKAALADDVIRNDGTLQALRVQVAEVWRALEQESLKRFAQTQEAGAAKSASVEGVPGATHA